MTEAYPNAPLVELIAEVQWYVPGHSLDAPQPAALDSSLYERFAVAMDELGFTHSERIVPEGFPALPTQIVSRFRKRRDQPPIYQIGPGIFSANGLPPTYYNWDGFSPFLFDGLDALHRARGESQEPYAFVKLRYIDAFGAKFLRGKSPHDFIERDLGFAVSIPPAVNRVALPETRPTVALQIGSRVSNSGNLVVLVGEALVNGEQSVVMDVAVQYANVRHGDARVRFREAHDIAHAIFEGTTSTVQDVLRGGVA